MKKDLPFLGAKGLNFRGFLLLVSVKGKIHAIVLDLHANQALSFWNSVAQESFTF
jgi:hypothetical protein